MTLSAYDLLPDGDLDEAFVARLAKVDVGDWVPARRPARLGRVARKIPGASAPVATTSVRVVARLVDADHVESWDAERALADAVARVHECAETGDDADAQSAFDALEAAFAVKRCRARRRAPRSATETKKETRSESPAASARACLDVARADTRSTSTALARACARPTPAGEACALRLLSLGAKPSVSYRPNPASPVAISSSGGDGEDGEEDAVERAARRHASTAAHVAARANNWRVLARMLDLDATGVLGARDGEGYPALHVAITARAVEATQVLARGGADPEIEVCVNAGRERERDRSRPVTGRGRARTRERVPSSRLEAATIASSTPRSPRLASERRRKRKPQKKKSAARGRSLTSALFARGARRRRARRAEPRGGARRRLRETPAFARATRRRRQDRAGDRRGSRRRGRDPGPARRWRVDTIAARAGRWCRRRGAMAWAAYARSDEAVEAVLAAGVTASGEWAAASRVAETRGASMRVRRVLRGRAERGTA